MPREAVGDAAGRRAEARPGSGVITYLELARVVGRVTSVRAACEEIVDYLFRRDGVLISIYLEQAGRLRCQAERGYWQVLDGIPPSAGVIGRCFRSGQPILVEQVADEPEYLAAAANAVSELCLPIVVRGRVLGAINAEAEGGLPAGLHARMDDCLALLIGCIERLGPGPRPSLPQRLARHAARLAELAEADAIETACLVAATDVAGMSSAMIAAADPAGTWRVSASSGPLGSVFGGTPPEALGAMAAWVARGTASYTMGDRRGTGLRGHEPLRDGGAGTLIVLPLGTPGNLQGMLAVADARVERPSPEVVELLELLAAQAGSCLRTVAAVQELRERAARDPLTGLGHHGSFHDALARVTRPGEPPCAVMLLDVDHFKALNDGRGHLVGDRVLRGLAEGLTTTLGEHGRLFRVGGDEFAALVRVSGADELDRLATRLGAAARLVDGTTLSIGIAVSAPGDTSTDLVARADRALYDVKRAGRDGARLCA